MIKIYKYCRVKDFLLNVDNNTIVLSKPGLFNDPFDSNITILQQDIDKTIELVNEYSIYQILSRIKELPQELVDKLNTYRENVITSGRFETASLFDSIYAKIKNNAAALLLINNAKFKNETIDKLPDIKDKILVSCFSLINDSLLMWAHYGDSHKGVCIEYDYPKNNFMNVNYQNNKEFFKLYDLASVILCELLKKHEISLDADWLIDNYGKPFITKSIEWSYEKEVRCLFYEPDIQQKCKKIYDKDGNEIKGKYLFKMPTRINKVIIGCRVSDEDEAKIRKKCQEHNIEIEKMTASDNEYKLERVED